MNDLSRQALSHLGRVVRDDGLFPFSTSIADGNELKSSYDTPLARRYTLISLLGLDEARRAGATSPIIDSLDEVIGRFLQAHEHKISNMGDSGLLLALLARSAMRPSRQRELLETVRGARARRSDLSVQDLAWLQFGALEASYALPEATEVARALFSTMSDHYVHDGAWFPRHSLSGLRGRVVSFGAVTYYLHALHRFARRLDDDDALARFRSSVTRMLELQLPSGGWPWLLDAQKGVALEVYPLFSVHQLSMAMLFLLPAAELGVPGAQDAIRRSFAWVGGSNELSTPLVLDGGRFIYRSIECTERWGRGKRYARAMTRSTARRAVATERVVGLRVNTESRSYEWGWLLWVWSSRPTTPALTASEAT